MRRPDETAGGRGSNGTALRLTVIPTAARRSSACWPSSSDSRRSHNTRCTSVPPVRTLTPPPARRSSSAPARARSPEPAGAQELIRHRTGALDGSLLTLAKRLRRGDPQRHRLAGDHVLERSALLTR